jgi:hypothetical protein
MAEIRGLAEVKKAIRRNDGRIRNALAAGLYLEGLRIIGQAVRLTPVKTNRLRASHYAAPPNPRRARPEVEIGYGVDYAVPVHERLEVNHPNGEAKFLQKPLDKARSGWETRIALRTKQNFERGTRLGSIPATAPTRPRET